MKKIQNNNLGQAGESWFNRQRQTDWIKLEGKSEHTFCTRARVLGSVTAGAVLGIAHTMVTPPARAAAVPEEKSSLCVAPGSRR